MRVVAAALGLLAITSPVSAEEPWLYGPMVTDCYARGAAEGGAESCIGDAAQACMESEEGGYSTAGMANCVLAERDVWDGLLNAVYGQARDAARLRDAAYQSSDPQFAKSAESLLAAQRAWISFRDANCAMQRDVWGNGSMRVTASAGCHMQMTAERTLELHNYIDLER